jgi:hypothetical protein
MKIQNRFLLAAGLSLLSAIPTIGQDVAGRFCKQIEESVVQRLNPINVNRIIVSNNECDFEFTLSSDRLVSLSIEKHNTERESHEAIDRFFASLGALLGYEDQVRLPFQYLDTKNSWDEQFFLAARHSDSAVLVVRTGELSIQMLAEKDATLIRMERLLRNNPNLKNCSSQK